MAQDAQDCDTMKKFKIFIAESVAPDDFYEGNCEGHVVQAMAKVLHWQSSYKVALNAETLCRAIKHASNSGYDILHISCHGDAKGIELTDGTELSWKDLAECFQETHHAPHTVVVSSCAGGHGGVADAFRNRTRRPSVIFAQKARQEGESLFPVPASLGRFSTHRLPELG